MLYNVLSTLVCRACNGAGMGGILAKFPEFKTSQMRAGDILACSIHQVHAPFAEIHNFSRINYFISLFQCCGKKKGDYQQRYRKEECPLGGLGHCMGWGPCSAGACGGKVAEVRQ